MLEREKAGAPKEEIEAMGVGKLRLAVVEGDVQGGSVMAGQVAGMVNKKAPVEEIISDLINGLQEAKTSLDERLNSWK